MQENIYWYQSGLCKRTAFSFLDYFLNISYHNNAFFTILRSILYHKLTEIKKIIKFSTKCNEIYKNNLNSPQ